MTRSSQRNWLIILRGIIEFALQIWRKNISRYHISLKQKGYRDIQWCSQGETVEPPPLETGKKRCRKMMLFPNALILATTFPKIVKNSIFLLNFYQKFSKISENLTNCVFRPNARKSKAWFVIVFGKYAKNARFAILWKRFFQNFLKIFNDLLCSSKRAKN